MHSPYNRPPPPPLGTLKKLCYYRAYVGVPNSVSTARNDLRAAAEQAGLDADTIETAVLCLSELVTNAVVHAGALSVRFRVNVSVRRDQRMMRLEVYDHHACTPAFPPPQDVQARLQALDPDALGGRGLALVASLAYRTGVEEAVIGKTVWCDLKLTPPHISGGPPLEVQEQAAAGVCGVSSSSAP